MSSEEKIEQIIWSALIQTVKSEYGKKMRRVEDILHNADKKIALFRQTFGGNRRKYIFFFGMYFGNVYLFQFQLTVFLTLMERVFLGLNMQSSISGLGRVPMHV